MRAEFGFNSAAIGVRINEERDHNRSHDNYDDNDQNCNQELAHKVPAFGLASPGEAYASLPSGENTGWPEELET